MIRASKTNTAVKSSLRVITNNAGEPKRAHRNEPVKQQAASEITITEDDLFIPELGRQIDPATDAQKSNPSSPSLSSKKTKWVLVAHLSLETPLKDLYRHGETIDANADEVQDTPIDSPYLCWVPSSAEGTNIHGDPIIDTSDSITMDIQADEASPLRYRKFLIQLRTILESEETPSEKREAITSFVNNEHWIDITCAWGSLDSLLDRLIPPFLVALQKHLGIPQHAVNTLRTIGIVSRMDLANALENGFPGISSLENLEGIGPATISRLQHYRVDEDNLDDGTRQVLGDPYMQVVF